LTSARPPRPLARTLGRGWTRDGRRWVWLTAAVLASTLVVLVGSAGVLEGMQQRTLGQVSDFFTGDTRVTPEHAGALPSGWFNLSASSAGGGAAQVLGAAGGVVAVHAEAQYILTRQSFLDIVLHETGRVPLDQPASDADPSKIVAIGALVGIPANDAGNPALAAHLVAGRLPHGQPAGERVEIAMSVRRLQGLATQVERSAIGSPPSMDVAGALDFELTSGQIDASGGSRDVIRAPARIVGLFDTGVQFLDSYTVLAPIEEVRALLGRAREEPIANALLVSGASPAAVADVAAGHGWSSQSSADFAHAYLGSYLDLLRFSAAFDAALLFVLPAALVSHGLSRQMASYQRELAILSAIGVRRAAIARALGVQVAAIGARALLMAGVALLVLAVSLPSALAGIRDAPLPLGFVLPAYAVVGGAVVAAVALAVAWLVGVRSGGHVPLASALRSL
jgi:hypothetical protein